MTLLIFPSIPQSVVLVFCKCLYFNIKYDSKALFTAASLSVLALKTHYITAAICYGANLHAGARLQDWRSTLRLSSLQDGGVCEQWWMTESCEALLFYTLHVMESVKQTGVRVSSSVKMFLSEAAELIANSSSQTLVDPTALIEHELHEMPSRSLSDLQWLRIAEWQSSFPFLPKLLLPLTWI